MNGISSEIVGIIYQLLPGFVVAWIIYGLTSHLKQEPFERVVEALIYTVIIRSIVIISKTILIIVGEKIYYFGYWNSETEFVSSIFYSIFFGLLISWCINNDFPVYLFRDDGEELCINNSIMSFLNNYASKIKLTNKTFHPTEWYSAFCSGERYVVLHLKDERRLYGWPRQYPDDPNIGHFLIEQPEWLLDDGSSAPLYEVKQILIPSSSVEFVEFLKEKEEYDAIELEAEISESKKKLTSLYKEGGE